MYTKWIRGPVGMDAARRVSRTGFRTVLVMIPSMTAGTRLMDLVPLLESDHRVQTVLTVPHADDVWSGVEDFVRHTGGLVVPWQQARQHEWDLVLTASHRHIEQVRGRVLILPHGAGNVMSRRFSRKAGVPTRPTTGLDAELLMFRGRVIPSAIALTHESELKALRRSCPEAVHTAVVAGDVCIDRMVTSLRYRDQYRTALGVGAEETLVTVSSTWSTSSVFGQHPRLYSQITREARAAGVRVAAVVHPMVWSVHGALQTRLWLADAIRHGLLVIPPYDGWQATMIASDLVVGDHGSTTIYAAALGRPVHLATFPQDDIRQGSLAATMASGAHRLDHDKPLLPQLHRRQTRSDRVVGALTSRPGGAGKVFRTTMYGLLGLAEPPWPPSVPPYPLPRPLWQ